MSVVWLFPGQGTTRVDAAMRFAVAMPRGRALLDAAARAVDIAPSRLLARPELLEATEVAQPVLTAVSLFVAGELATAGLAPVAVLGHSLGEIAAWAVATGADPARAVGIAALRGAAMGRAAAAAPGGLVALASSDGGAIEGALALGRKAGALDVAAWNAPDETVLSGDEAAIRAVLAGAAVRATRVPTAGPWHGPAMAPAVAPVRAALAEAAGGALRCAFVSNRDGAIFEDAAALPARLADQLVHPVAFRAALATAASLATDFVTVGPGAVLRSLVRRNAGDGARAQRLHATDDARALAETIRALEVTA